MEQAEEIFRKTSNALVDEMVDALNNGTFEDYVVKNNIQVD